MSRVPVQKQTTGIHSALSEPELFSGQPSFPSNGNETKSLFTHSIQVLWGVQLCFVQADPDVSKDHSALIFKVEHPKKTISAGYAENCSPNDMV